MHGQDGKPAGIKLPQLLCHKNGRNLDMTGVRGTWLKGETRRDMGSPNYYATKVVEI